MNLPCLESSSSDVSICDDNGVSAQKTESLEVFNSARAIVLNYCAEEPARIFESSKCEAFEKKILKNYGVKP